MPKSRWYKYLLVVVDIHWMGRGFSHTERTGLRGKKKKKKNKTCLRRKSHFGLPQSIQSDTSKFTSKMPQQVAETLGENTPFLQHRDPNPQGKWKKMNDTWKWTISKLCQETQENRVQILPITLMRIRATPQKKLRCSPYELMYGRPFLTNGFVLDEETAVLPWWLKW